MRVVVNEKFKVFHGHVPTQLQAGQEVSGELAAFLLEHAPGKVTRADVEPEPGPPAELDIDASAAVVLSWVGEDRERAGVALVAEQAKEKPRAGLVKALEKLTAPAES